MWRQIPFGVMLTCLLAGWSLGLSVSWCNIPVFRYALERWRPDPCRLVFFYEDQLKDEDRSYLERLESEAAKRKFNLEWVAFNVRSQENRELRELWESLKDQPNLTLPHVVTRTNLGQGKVVHPWQGSPKMVPPTLLIDSPIRRELVKRTLAGDSSVWLLIKSKDAAKNQKTKEMLHSVWRRLESELELPDGIGLPGSELHSEVPLFLRFSLLEVDPNDPQEKYLVSLMTGFQPDALENGDPLVVPIFGKGRALEVIPSSHLEEGLVADLCKFLCGACSCQVKEKNPGFDLLLACDWNVELFGEGGVVPSPDEGLSKRGSNNPTLLTIPPGKKNR